MAQEKLLRVTSPRGGKHGQGICAGAVFVKVGGEWKLKDCANVLGWWRRTSVANIKKWLNGPAKRVGWKYEWVKGDCDVNV